MNNFTNKIDMNNYQNNYDILSDDTSSNDTSLILKTHYGIPVVQPPLTSHATFETRMDLCEQSLIENIPLNILLV